MEHLFFSAGGMIQDVEICVLGDELLDAGSEVNDEIPMNTAFFGQTVDGTGVDQGGVIQLHPGFLPAGSGGILDSAMFSNADFTVSGYKVLTICVALEGEEARCMVPPLATSQPTNSPTRAPSSPTSGPGLVAAFNSGGTGKKKSWANDPLAQLTFLNAAFTDSQGTVWLGDASILVGNGGLPYSDTSVDIVGTIDDELYQVHRFGFFQYEIP